MADLKHGETLEELPAEELPAEELPAYASAFKEVYRFILEALEGDVVAATALFQKYLAGELPEELLCIARCREKTEQTNGDEGDNGARVQAAPAMAA